MESLYGARLTVHIYVNQLVIKQKNVIRIMGMAQYNTCTHTSPLFKQIHIVKLHDLYQHQIAKYIHVQLFQTKSPTSTNSHYYI